MIALDSSTTLRLSAQLNLTGTFNHQVRLAGGQVLLFRLEVERGEAETRIALEIYGERHSLTLPTSERRNTGRLIGWIEGIANGTADTAAPEQIRAHTLPEPDALLSDGQLAQLRHLVEFGGYLALDTGLELPIQLMGNRHRRNSTPWLTVILCIGQRRPRTLQLNYRNAEVGDTALNSLAEMVSQLHDLASPSTAAA